MEKIKRFFVYLISLFFLNLFISLMSYLFIILLWTFIGDDNQYEMMKELGFQTAKIMFVVLSAMEIIWFSTNE